jgi:hypothetical protein
MATPEWNCQLNSDSRSRANSRNPGGLLTVPYNVEPRGASLDRNVILEVPILHPTLPWFGRLGYFMRTSLQR